MQHFGSIAWLPSCGKLLLTNMRYQVISLNFTSCITVFNNNEVIFYTDRIFY